MSSINNVADQVYIVPTSKTGIVTKTEMINWYMDTLLHRRVIYVGTPATDDSFKVVCAKLRKVDESIFVTDDSSTVDKRITIDTNTRTYIVSHSYKIAILLDLSESSSFVHFRYKLVNAELIAVQLQTLLEQLCESIQTRDGRELLHQTIHVSIMAHFPMNLLSGSEHVIVDCLHLDNITSMDQIMNMVNSKLRQLVSEICCVKIRSNKLISNLDLKSGHECKLLSDLSNELCNIVNSGIMLLDMMPDSVCNCGADMFGRNDQRLIVLITDGLMSISNPALLESLRKSLIQRHIGLSVIVAEPPEIKSSTSDMLSHLSYEKACVSTSFKSATVFAMISTSMCSLGSLIVPRVEDPEFQILKYSLHRILLCSIFSNETSLYEKSARVVKNYAELKMPFSVPELLCLKIAGHGFSIRSSSHEESGIQMLANGNLAVKLVRSCVGPYRLCYKIVGSACTVQNIISRNRGDFQSVVSIFSESDQTCIPQRRRCVGYRTKKLVDDIVWRIIEVDRMMISFINSMDECPWDTYRSTVPMFLASSNPVSKGQVDLAHQLRRAHSATKFCMMWKPLVSVHPSYWCWCFRDFKVTLLLEHDSPLPNFNVANDSTKAEVECKNAKQELNTLIQEFFPITLLETRVYLKFIHENKDCTLPTRFCLLYACETECSRFFVILRFYFSYAASSEMCTSVIQEITDRIPMLRCRQPAPHTIVNINSSISLNQFSTAPLSKKTRRCSIVDRQLLRLDTTSISSPAYFYRLPRPLLHELIVQHISFPYDLLGKTFNHDDTFSKSKISNETVQRSALSRFFSRRLWIRSFANFENAQISTECVEAIIGTLIRQRLTKGFHFVSSTKKGMHIMFNEFALTKGSEVIPCLVQYVVFPVVFDDLLHFAKLIDGCPLSSESEVYFVTECWIEPQDGDKSIALNTFSGIVDQIKLEDDDIFRIFVSLEYSLSCRMDYLHAVGKFYDHWNSIITSKSHSELIEWIWQGNEEIPRADKDTLPNYEFVQDVTFDFDCLSLLDHSNQALSLLTCFGTDESNTILIRKFNSLLGRATNCTQEYNLFKTPGQCIQWIYKALRRVELSTRRNLKINGFIQNLKTNEIGWRSFFKYIPGNTLGQSAFFVILTPSLHVLNCWNDHINWEASNTDRNGSNTASRVLPIVICYVSKAIITNKIWCSGGYSLSQSPSCSSMVLPGSFSSLSANPSRSDTIVFDYTRSTDDNLSALSMSTNIVVSHATVLNPQSVVHTNLQQSMAYKSPHFRKRDRSRSITIHSVAEEVAMDILCRQCEDLRETFDNLLVNGIFECSRRGIPVERNDLDFTLSMCQERSNEIPLTDLIRLYCSHMRSYPKLTSAGLQASVGSCKPFGRDPGAFQKRFMSVVNEYFRPIPNCNDIFYYSHDLVTRYFQADWYVKSSILPDPAKPDLDQEAHKSDDLSANGSVPFFITFSVRFICRSYDKIIPFDPNIGFPLCLNTLMTEIDDVHPSIPLSDIHILLDVISVILATPSEEQTMNISTLDDFDESCEEVGEADSTRVTDPHRNFGVERHSFSYTGGVNYHVPLQAQHPAANHHHYFAAQCHQCQLMYQQQHPHASQQQQQLNPSLNSTQGSLASSSSSKLKRQLSVMAKCMTELRWILTDELTSIMLSFPICRYHINIAAEHILGTNSISRKELTRNCKQCTVSLKFIMGVQTSCDAFEQELQSAVISHKFKLAPISNGFYILTLAQKDTSDGESARRSHSTDKHEKIDDFIDKSRKRFCSDQDKPLSERLLVRSVSSVGMDDIFQDIGPWMSPKALPKFWLLLKIRSQPSSSNEKDQPTHFADVIMHLRESDMDGPVAEEAETVFNKVLRIAKSICLKVNKKLILLDLEDTRMCAPFLVPDEDDASISSTENVQEDKYLAANLDISIKPGQFACDLQWTAVFTLHPRLRAMNVRHTKGFATVENALHSFIIYNRRNMFVYRTIDTSSIYYMIVKENRLSDARNHGNFDIFSESMLDSANDQQKRRPVSLIDYENISKYSVPETPQICGMTNRVDCVAVHMYGLNEPDQSVKDHITSLVSKKLDDDTLGELLEILQRNAKCRLYSDDVQFIKRNQDDSNVYYYTMPYCEHFEYASEYMHYLKQALNGLLIVPNYSEDAYSPNRLTTPTSFSSTAESLTPSMSSTRTCCPSPISTTVPSGDRCFYFIHTIYRAVGVGNQGVSWIETNICDLSGTLVNLQVPALPNALNLQILMNRGIGCFPRWTDIHRCSLSDAQETDSNRQWTRTDAPPHLLLKIRVWKKGEIDIPDLMAKLEPCLSHAMVLLLTEYMVLSDPFPAVISSENSSMLSPRTTFKSHTLCLKHISGIIHGITCLLSFNLINSPIGTLPCNLGDRSSTASPEFGSTRERSITDLAKSGVAPTSSCSVLQTFHQSNSWRYRYFPLTTTRFEFVLTWLDFANCNCGPEFKKQSHTIPYEFLVLQAVDQYMRWLRIKLRLDLLLYSRSSPDDAQYVMCDDNSQFLKQLIHSFSESPVSGYIDIAVIVRDIDLWLSLFGGAYRGGGSEFAEFDGAESAVHHASCYSMRYEPFQCNQKEHRYCVPRQAFVILHAKRNKLSLYCYNWSASLSDAICLQLTKICQFHCKRSALLDSVLLQQLNLFNLNVYSSCATSDAHDISQLLNGADSGMFAASEAKKAGSTTAVNASTAAAYESSRDIDSGRFPDLYRLNIHTYLMVKRILPLDIVIPPAAAAAAAEQPDDPVNILGMWAMEVREIYDESTHCGDRLRSLYESWLVRQKSPISVNTLNILKHYSRCLHSVATPLLFYNQARVCLNSQKAGLTFDTLSLTAGTSSMKSRIRRTSGAFGVRSFSAIVGGCSELVGGGGGGGGGGNESQHVDEDDEEEDVSWKQEIATLFFQQYQSYLATLGFSAVVLSECSSHSLLMQKTIRGFGIILLEVVRSSEDLGHFFVVRVYQYDCKPNAIDILLSSPALDDAGDRIRDITHFNSFTYDFHLRLIHSYLCDPSSVLSDNFPVISFLHDLLTYYTDRPIYARNIVWIEDWYIEIQALPKEVFEYIIEHGSEYDIEVKRNNSRIQSPSFILHSSHNDAQYNICRLAYFPSPAALPIRSNYQHAASSSSSAGSSRSNSKTENSVKIMAFTIMMRKGDVFPLVDLAEAKQSSSGVLGTNDVIGENWEGAADDTGIVRLSGVKAILPMHSTYLVGRRDEKALIKLEQALQTQLKATRDFFQNMVSDASKSFLRDRLWGRLVQCYCSQKANRNNIVQGQVLLPLCFTEFEELLSHTLSNNLIDLDPRLDQLINLSSNMTYKFLDYISTIKGSVGTFSDGSTAYVCLFCGVMDPSDTDYGGSRGFVFSGKSGSSQLSVYGGFEITESFILIKIEKNGLVANRDSEKQPPEVISRTSPGVSSSGTTSAVNTLQTIVQIDVVRRSKTVPHSMAIACVNAFVNAACYFVWENLL